MKTNRGTLSVRGFGIALYLLIFALTLIGCSQHPKKEPPEFKSKFVVFSHGRILVDRTAVDNVNQIYKKLQNQTQKTVELIIVQEISPNAYATLINGKYKIAISIGMIDLLEDRWDEYAFVLAHELSHVTLDHVRERSKYRKKTNTGSEILGFTLSLLGMPFGFVATDAGGYLFDLKYDRDQERLADEQALRYMLVTGYDLAAASRFHERLSEFSIARATNLLSTHPTSTERIENTRRFVERLKQGNLER